MGDRCYQAAREAPACLEAIVEVSDMAKWPSLSSHATRAPWAISSRPDRQKISGLDSELHD